MNLSNENAFLRAILANPSDVVLRLVYADWLEECGDEQSDLRAEYLRVECELEGLPAKTKSKARRRRRLQDRLLELREVITEDWWRALDYTNVEHCVEFEFQCQQRWDLLSPTADPGVRHCEECQRDVHYCHSSQDAFRLALAGKCVAIDSRLVWLPLHLVRRAQQTGRTLGRVTFRAPKRIPLSVRGST